MIDTEKATRQEGAFALIEQFQMGKNPEIHPEKDQMCEDAIVANADFAAVIDGSTSKGLLRFNGKTTGRMAMEILADAVLNVLSPEDEMPHALAKLTASIRKFYEKNGLCEEVARHAENRLTASMAVYSARKHEVWMIGDCLCRFNGVTHTNPKRVDAVLATVRADATRYLLQKGHSIAELQTRDLAREWIWPYLKDQCAFQNSDEAGPFGYAVLDGFPVNASKVLVLPIPRNTQELVLASDGYPVLCDTLMDSEHELAQLLEEDPLCIGKSPSTKGLAKGNRSFDDRSFLRIALY